MKLFTYPGNFDSDSREPMETINLYRRMCFTNTCSSCELNKVNTEGNSNCKEFVLHKSEEVKDILKEWGAMNPQAVF